MKYLFLFCFSVGTLLLSAQNETYQIEENRSNPGAKADYLVGDIIYVPFKNQLYKSHFDKELMQYNQLDYNELRDALQKGLEQSVAQACDSNYTMVSLGSHQSRMKEDRNILHEALKYDYKMVPTETNGEEDGAKEKVNALMSRFKSKGGSKKREGTYIEDGQIKSNTNQGSKYMSVYLEDKDILKVFAASYNNSYVLSMNQFEFVVPATADPIQLQTGHYKRNLVVHYSFLNKQGKEVKGGKAIVEVPSDVLSMDEITGVYLAEMGRKIAQSLPQPKHEPQIER